MSGITQMVLGTFSGAAAPGQVVFSGKTGSTSWVVPAGVSSISIVAIGRGGGATYAISNQVTPGLGGGGAALAYKNNIAVAAGQSVSIEYNSDTSSGSTSHAGVVVSYGGSVQVAAEKGSPGGSFDSTAGNSNYSVGDAKYSGGAGAGNGKGSGGAPAGYDSDGPGPATSTNGNGNEGLGGSGGSGAAGAPYGNYAGAGGGTGLTGKGSNGTAGTSSGGGGGGSGGTDGEPGGSFSTISTNFGGRTGDGGDFGGGSSGSGAAYGYGPTPNAGDAGNAGVRIIWGAGRAYPSTNTADQ